MPRMYDRPRPLKRTLKARSKVTNGPTLLVLAAMLSSGPQSPSSRVSVSLRRVPARHFALDHFLFHHAHPVDHQLTLQMIKLVLQHCCREPLQHQRLRPAMAMERKVCWRWRRTGRGWPDSSKT